METIQQEVAQEVSQLLAVIVSGWRKTGKLDLEAVETATRSAAHHIGATVLGELLSVSPPVPRQVACPCGHQAPYHDTRPKQLQTVVGRVRFERAYYRCRHCHRGHSPGDRELDVEGTACSPGVRRMMAMVGSETSLEQGREQLAVLAGLEITAKAIERHAEALGADIEAREQVEIQRAKQLELPPVCGPAVPVLPRARSVCRLRRRRGGLQDRHRSPAQAFRHVLDRARRQRHPRSTLLPPQRQVRGLLGDPINCCLTFHIYVAHPLATDYDPQPQISLGWRNSLKKLVRRGGLEPP